MGFTMKNIGNLFFHGNRNKRKIALTFDDGPSRETLKLLKLLKKEKVKATFFVLGKKIEGSEEIIKKIINERHELGNHGYSHKSLIFKTNKVIFEEIKKCDDLLLKSFNIRTSLFRPPYFQFGLNALVATYGLKKKVIFCDVLSKDWKLESIESIVWRVLSKTKNGSIINLHDYLENIGPNKNIVKVTKNIIFELKRRGYKFVTVSELLNFKIF